MSEHQSEKLSLVSVVAIGMGGMIGAGIFALLGVAVSIAGGGVWMAFLLGGIAAVASAYSFSHLALAYPSRGGAATYVNRAFASSMLAGSLNVLLWLGYVVVSSRSSDWVRPPGETGKWVQWPPARITTGPENVSVAPARPAAGGNRQGRGTRILQVATVARLRRMASTLRPRHRDVAEERRQTP